MVLCFQKGVSCVVFCWFFFFFFFFFLVVVCGYFLVWVLGFLLLLFILFQWSYMRLSQLVYNFKTLLRFVVKPNHTFPNLIHLFY